MNIGLETKEDLEKLKSLKEGDILYTAYFENENNTVGTSEYTFEKYIDPPKGEDQNGVWAKLKGKENNISVILNIKLGLYFTPEAALENFKNKLYSMYEAAEAAIKDLKKEDK